MSPGMMIVPALAASSCAVASSPVEAQLATSPATSAVTGACVGIGVGVAGWVGVDVGAFVGVGVGACVGVGVGACVGAGVGPLTVTVIEASVRPLLLPPATPRAATVWPPTAADDGTV